MIRRLALDVDNVLADSIASWCVKASKYLGYPVEKNEIKSHKIVGSVPMEPVKIFGLQDQVWEDWRNLPTTEPELARRISDIRRMSIEVIIVTSRPLRLASLIQKWLAQKAIHYDEFYPIGPYVTKASLRADALVDDSPEMVESFVKSNRTGFLFSQPWNRDHEPTGAIVVKNFRDILDFLERKRNQP